MGVRELKEIKVNSGVKIGYVGVKAAFNAIAENRQRLAKALSGQKTMKEVIKGYNLPVIAAGRAMGELIGTTTKHNLEVIGSVFNE